VELLVAEAMRRTRSRRAGARASLCHRLPDGSSAVMPYRWRGKDWFTTVWDYSSALAMSQATQPRVKNTRVTEELGPAVKISRDTQTECAVPYAHWCA
jgi:hypothetical protein